MAHPQDNGQTEVSNNTIINGLKKHLMKSKGAWAEELPTVLRSYHMTPRSSTGETPFSLTYNTEVVLPAEILEGSLQVMEFNVNANKSGKCQDLDMLDVKRKSAQLRQASYKTLTKNYYNQPIRVKNFKVEEWMLIKIESSHSQPHVNLSVT